MGFRGNETGRQLELYDIEVREDENGGKYLENVRERLTKTRNGQVCTFAQCNKMN